MLNSQVTVDLLIYINSLVSIPGVGSLRFVLNSHLPLIFGEHEIEEEVLEEILKTHIPTLDLDMVMEYKVISGKLEQTIEHYSVNGNYIGRDRFVILNGDINSKILLDFNDDKYTYINYNKYRTGIKFNNDLYVNNPGIHIVTLVSNKLVIGVTNTSLLTVYEDGVLCYIPKSFSLIDYYDNSAIYEVIKHDNEGFVNLSYTAICPEEFTGMLPINIDQLDNKFNTCIIPPKHELDSANKIMDLPGRSPIKIASVRQEENY